MGKRLLLLLVLAVLVSCEATPEPTSTPIVIQNFATIPELENTVVSWLTEYQEKHERGALHLEVLPHDLLQSTIDSGEAELAILGETPPEKWFVTPLLREAMVVIVNTEIPIQSLSLRNLEGLFSGKTKSWESLAEVEVSVQLVIPFRKNIYRDRFIQVVMNESAFDPSSRLASSSEDILEFVRSEEGAIGFIPATQIGSGVKVIEIEGIAPSEGALEEGQYPLWVDIIATAPKEPVGSLRDFLGWLQGTYLPVR